MAKTAKPPTAVRDTRVPPARIRDVRNVRSGFFAIAERIFATFLITIVVIVREEKRDRFVGLIGRRQFGRRIWSKFRSPIRRQLRSLVGFIQPWIVDGFVEPVERIFGLDLSCTLHRW